MVRGSSRDAAQPSHPADSIITNSTWKQEEQVLLLEKEGEEQKEEAWSSSFPRSRMSPL